MDSLLQRPIIGGVFGGGRYVLATVPCVLRGLHAVRFMVMDPVTGAVLSLADDKISVVIYPLKDGLKGGMFLRAKLADGTEKVMFGTPPRP